MTSENNTMVIEENRYIVDNKAVYFSVSAVMPCAWIGELSKSLHPKLLRLK